MLILREVHGESDAAYNNLVLGNYDSAISFYRKSFERNRGIQNTRLGALLWLTGEREAACKHWLNEITRIHNGREITHTDGAGGVLVPALLWWASAHEGLEEFEKPAIVELKKRWKTKRAQASHWPGPIANYILGGISDEELLGCTSWWSRPTTVQLSIGQAWFYISGKSLRSGGHERYIVDLKLATSTEVEFVEEEWFLARYELDRLDAFRPSSG